jgi:nucleoside-diphosphate-sugar epimerase
VRPREAQAAPRPVATRVGLNRLDPALSGSKLILGEAMREIEMGAPRVLFLGGTGIISTSCVRRAVAEGLEVHVLNRGINAKGRSLPEPVHRLIGDITEPASVVAAVGDLTFDSVVNFLSFDADDASAAIDIFRGRTHQYVHISTAGMYKKPIPVMPISESTPRGNQSVQYFRDKIAAEDRLMQACFESGFPVTIVRPSQTYDETNPPLPSDWTMFDRIERGAEIIVPGDGTSLWTLTHADDVAEGLVGLIANPRTMGEVFNITSDEVYTWNQIYAIIAQALGVEPRLVHIPSELICLGAPDWWWSDVIQCDLSHSALFDTTKLRRVVPSFAPRMRFHRAVHDMVDWRRAHPENTVPKPSSNAIIDRLVAGYHRSREAFESLGAQTPS